MQDEAAALDMLTSLRSLGVQLLIDDFGTGYSTLRALQQLPLDGIKIDMSFIQGVEHDATQQVLVKSIIDMADALRLDVVAESVEKAEQHAFLSQAGCPPRPRLPLLRAAVCPAFRGLAPRPRSRCGSVPGLKGGAVPAMPCTPEDIAVVRELAGRAVSAATTLRRAPVGAIDGVLLRAAMLLEARQTPLLDANEADVAAGIAAGLSPGNCDRLRLDESRLRAMAGQLRELAESRMPVADRLVRLLPDGKQVMERRVPVGVVGAIFEARPNVTVDVASQVLRARSAVVLRTGSAALRTSSALVDEVLLPALADGGLPTDAVQLVRSAGHGTAAAVLLQPDLIPLVVVRGSGPVTRHLAAIGASAGVQVLAHADGGGVLYVDRTADLSTARRLVTDSLDRLGVCNRLNLLLLDEQLPATAVETLLAALSDAGVKASLAPHSHPIGHEWALDAGAEATVTVDTVSGAEQAARIADHETSGLAAAVCTEDEAVFGEFLDNYGGTAVLWNASTRLVDGYAMLGIAETGINVDRSLGPRGPVTYLDLGMRQYVVRPATSTRAAPP